MLLVIYDKQINSECRCVPFYWPRVAARGDRSHTTPDAVSAVRRVEVERVAGNSRFDVQIRVVRVINLWKMSIFVPLGI